MYQSYFKSFSISVKYSEKIKNLINTDINEALEFAIQIVNWIQITPETANLFMTILKVSNFNI